MCSTRNSTPTRLQRREICRHSFFFSFHFCLAFINYDYKKPLFSEPDSPSLRIISAWGGGGELYSNELLNRYWSEIFFFFLIIIVIIIVQNALRTVSRTPAAHKRGTNRRNKIHPIPRGALTVCTHKRFTVRKINSRRIYEHYYKP